MTKGQKGERDEARMLKEVKGSHDLSRLFLFRFHRKYTLARGDLVIAPGKSPPQFRPFRAGQLLDDFTAGVLLPQSFNPLGRDSSPTNPDLGQARCPKREKALVRHARTMKEKQLAEPSHFGNMP